MNIANEIGLEAVLGQLAEEAAELAQAALKLQRIIHGTNPTPVTEEEARENLLEEADDVNLCLAVLSGAGIDTHDSESWLAKAVRWEQRIRKAKEDKE